MTDQQKHALLCPNCRRLISADEESCPHCGIRNPGARWRSVMPAERLFGGDNLVRNVIVLNAAMFILSILMNPGSAGFSMNPLSFLSPGDRSLLLLGATGTVPIDRFGRWWTLLSANYLHGSILHILFNMMAFRQIAPLIIQEYGRYRMISIYTLSGVGGYVLSYIAGVPFTIGASAALCGLIGAALYYGKSRGGYFGQMVYQQLLGWVIGIFAFGFLVPGINNWAHGGGLLFGIITGFLLSYLEKKPETSFHSLLAGVCVLATLLTLAWALGSSILILASA
ncbi:MAG: rhomboid family intramembrane serine protease [Syntrophobacteraceae bacterium]